MMGWWGDVVFPVDFIICKNFVFVFEELVSDHDHVSWGQLFDLIIQALYGIAPCEAVFVLSLLISLEHYVSLLGIHHALVQCTLHCVCPVVVVFTQVAQNITDDLGHVVNEVELVVVVEVKVLIRLTEVLLADEILEGCIHIDRWFIFRFA